MADVCVGTLHGDLPSLGADGRSLRAELNVELSDGNFVSRGRLRRLERHGDDEMTYLDPILQLDLATGVHRDVLERLACAIVRFAAALEGLQHGSLVYAPRDVGVEGAGAARAASLHYDRPTGEGGHALKAADEIEHIPLRDLRILLLQANGLHCLFVKGGENWVECGMKGSVEIAG